MLKLISVWRDPLFLLAEFAKRWVNGQYFWIEHEKLPKQKYSLLQQDQANSADYNAVCMTSCVLQLLNINLSAQGGEN